MNDIRAYGRRLRLDPESYAKLWKQVLREFSASVRDDR